MNYYQPDSWVKRLMSAVLLLLGIAVGARVIYELLAPVVPVAITLLLVCAAYLVLMRRLG